MIERYRENIKYHDLLVVRAAQEASLLEIPYWDDVRDVWRRLFPLSQGTGTITPGDCIAVSGEMETADRELLRGLITRLLPWRKGPFNLFGIEIDSEWKSNWKWDRIVSAIPDVQGKRVGDVGCNNGYYLFRLIEREPEIAIGVDPNARFKLQFDLVRDLAGIQNAHYEMLGIEHMRLFEEFFDLLLCMGVIYHRRDPVEALRTIFQALRPGGIALVESITVPGRRGEVLVPRERYAMMRNVWALPSDLTLAEWMAQAGFEDVELVSTSLTTIDEQRKTTLAPYDSLSDFLDPMDPTKTIEGYPAPTRTCFRGVRPG